MFYLRRNFDRLNTRELKYFLDNTLIPVSLQKYETLVTSPFIQQLLSFQYFASPELLDDKVAKDQKIPWKIEIVKRVSKILCFCWIRKTFSQSAQ